MTTLDFEEAVHDLRQGDLALDVMSLDETIKTLEAAIAKARRERSFMRAGDPFAVLDMTCISSIKELNRGLIIAKAEVNRLLKRRCVL